MKNRWCNHEFVLAQLEEFPDFFHHFHSKLFMIKMDCQELLDKGDKAISTLEKHLESGGVLNKQIAIAHVNLLCRQKKHLSSPKVISKTFVKYFYESKLTNQQKLALLIVYFEKTRRGRFEFDHNDLNYFFDLGKSSDSSIESFYNIFCHYILEFITNENLEEIVTIFKRLISPVKEVSNRRYRMLKSIVITEIIKWENQENLSLYTEFINSF
jgi:hypothetical protein